MRIMKTLWIVLLSVAIVGSAMGQPAPDKRAVKRTGIPKRGGLPFLSNLTAAQKENVLSRMSGMAMIQLAKKAGLRTIKGKDITQYPKLTKSPGKRQTLTDSPVATDPSYYENEPSIAVRPNRPNTIAVACHHYLSGPVDIAVYTSSDSGDTWSGPHYLPKRFAADTLSDPVIRYAPNGRYLYASYMSIRTDGSNAADIILSRSTNNGVSWQAPKVVIPAADWDNDGYVDVPDKPWLDVHPFANSSAANPMVYVTCTMFYNNGNTAIFFARSNNYAGSFNSGVWQMYRGQGGGDILVQGSRPMGGRNGAVLVCFYDAGSDGWGPDNSPSGGGTFNINVVSFTGYGLTLGNWVFAAEDISYELPYYLNPMDPVTLQGKYHRWWGGMFPSIGMTPNGTAFIAFTADGIDPNANPYSAECGEIIIIRAPAPYTNWIAPQRIGSSDEHAQGYPTLGGKKITGNCIVSIFWEDHSSSSPGDNELYDIVGAKHIDSYLGTYPISVSDFSSHSDYLFIGDYIDCSASSKVTANVTDRVIYVVWTDRSDQATTNGESDVWVDMFELFY